jgi:hypothetical protein
MRGPRQNEAGVGRITTRCQSPFPLFLPFPCNSPSLQLPFNSPSFVSRNSLHFVFPTLSISFRSLPHPTPPSPSLSPSLSFNSLLLPSDPFTPFPVRPFLPSSPPFRSLSSLGVIKGERRGGGGGGGGGQEEEGRKEERVTLLIRRMAFQVKILFRFGWYL